ncbi:hypothetical protein G7066_11580 [Leucobacter coleopterorum]|uniref:Uncharacterized protein n=1 Tax=Leucobacter coleopterorum TaxID=2714933 RepID=A0ABX6JXL7_9MICO|nr:hypothetical protein [Leucobacter coleopterorum]QIM19048.1 hypothetical protein G7066_11580 [Leucobacter coleopterorum]
MTRVNHDQLVYLRRAEFARDGLQLIPESANQLGFVGRHDRLVADSVPLDEIPSRMEDLEPTGTSVVDFAVPRFLLSLYNVVRDDRHSQPAAGGDEPPLPKRLWKVAMAEAEWDVDAYHQHQEMLAHLQQRQLGPGALALMPDPVVSDQREVQT